MLIRTRNSKDVVEFVVPRLSIRVLLWLGLCSPLFYLIGEQFYSVLGTRTTHADLILWHLLLWLEVGVVLWTLANKWLGGCGPLSRRFGRAVARFAARIPGGAASLFRFDLRQRLLEIRKEDKTRRDAFSVFSVVYVRHDQEHLHYRAGLGLAGDVRQLGSFASYAMARHSAERIARLLQLPLRDEVIGQTRQPTQLDDRLCHQERTDHPGDFPLLKEGRLTETRRPGLVALAFRPPLRISVEALLVGLFVVALAYCCGVLVFCLDQQTTGVEPSWWMLLISVPIGFLGFWAGVLLVGIQLLPVRLIVTPRRTGQGCLLFGWPIWLLSVRTASVENVGQAEGLMGPAIVTDRVVIAPFGGPTSETPEQRNWITTWMKWAINRQMLAERKGRQQ